MSNPFEGHKGPENHQVQSPGVDSQPISEIAQKDHLEDPDVHIEGQEGHEGQQEQSPSVDTRRASEMTREELLQDPDLGIILAAFDSIQPTGDPGRLSANGYDLTWLVCFIVFPRSTLGF
jgi:hypothetical protein